MSAAIFIHSSKLWRISSAEMAGSAAAAGARPGATSSGEGAAVPEPPGRRPAPAMREARRLLREAAAADGRRGCRLPPLALPDAAVIVPCCN